MHSAQLEVSRIAGHHRLRFPAAIPHDGGNADAGSDTVLRLTDPCAVTRDPGRLYASHPGHPFEYACYCLASEAFRPASTPTNGTKQHSFFVP